MSRHGGACDGQEGQKRGELSAADCLQSAVILQHTPAEAAFCRKQLQHLMGLPDASGRGEEEGYAHCRGRVASTACRNPAWLLPGQEWPVCACVLKNGACASHALRRLARVYLSVASMVAALCGGKFRLCTHGARASMKIDLAGIWDLVEIRDMEYGWVV